MSSPTPPLSTPLPITLLLLSTQLMQSPTLSPEWLMLLRWFTVLLSTSPQPQLLSTPPLSSVELARCPTSPCPSRSRVSTGPPPSPRPSELTSPPSTTLPAPSTEPTAGTDLLLLDMELSSVKKPK